jgi:hypothetical protein
MEYFPEGYEPTSKDILCGRGKGNLRHEGNQYFMKIIRANLGRYTDAPKRIDKSLVVSLIVSSLKDEGCNFVRQDSKTQRWFTLSEPQIHEKTGHAIRDILKKNKGAAPANQSKQAIQTSDEPDVVASQILSTALKVSKLVEKSKLDFDALLLAAQPQPQPQPQLQPTMSNSPPALLPPQRRRQSSIIQIFDNLSPEEPMVQEDFEFSQNNNNNNAISNDYPLPLDTRNSQALRPSDMMKVFDALSPSEELEIPHTMTNRRASSREFRRSELLHFLDFSEEELEEEERLGEESDLGMENNSMAAAAAAVRESESSVGRPLSINRRTSDTLNSLFKDQEEIFNNLQNIFTSLPDDEDNKESSNDQEMEEQNRRASQVLGELLKRQEGLFDELRYFESEHNVVV